jgi:hypothetical protein
MSFYDDMFYLVVRVTRTGEKEVSRGTLLTFVVGARQVVPWLDECVVGLRARAEAELVAVSESPESPRNALLRFRVEAVNVPSTAKPDEHLDGRTGETTSSSPRADADAIEESEKWRRAKSPGDFVRRAEELRVAANAIVTTKDIPMKKLRGALRPYHEALEWNRKAGKFEDTQLTVRILLNIALVLGRLDDWRSVLIYCDAVLELDPDNVKAYYRRGQAGANLGFYIRSVKDLERAAALAPADKGIQAELALAKKSSEVLLRKTRKEFAEVYNVMIQSPIYSSPNRQ